MPPTPCDLARERVQVGPQEILRHLVQEAAVGDRGQPVQEVAGHVVREEEAHRHPDRERGRSAQHPRRHAQQDAGHHADHRHTDRPPGRVPRGRARRPGVPGHVEGVPAGTRQQDEAQHQTEPNHDQRRQLAGQQLHPAHTPGQDHLDRGCRELHRGQACAGQQQEDAAGAVAHLGKRQRRPAQEAVGILLEAQAGKGDGYEGEQEHRHADQQGPAAAPPAQLAQLRPQQPAEGALGRPRRRGRRSIRNGDAHRSPPPRVRFRKTSSSATVRSAMPSGWIPNPTSASTRSRP
jgi:hypothetical protein